MSEVNIVITTQTTEVSDKTLSRCHAVVVKSPALPLGERERDLEFDVLKVARGECCGAFDTVEVVIEARALRDKERARNTLEVDIRLELVFERLLDEAESFLLGEEVLEDRLVAVHHLFGRKSGKGVFWVERSCHG